MTSLWKIDDTATQKLMTRFYANLFSKTQSLSTVESLREAQLWMLKEGNMRGKDQKALTVVPPAKGETPVAPTGRRSPPLFWAAFSLAGDWR